MGAYSDLVRAIQQRRSLFVVNLVQLGFTSGAMFVWLGYGPFRTADGQIWQGMGQVGGISEIDRQLVSSSTPTLSLSGVDATILARALDSDHEVKGRPVTIWEQYLDSDRSLVGAPVALGSWLMDQMRIATNAKDSTIAVTTAGLLYNRRRPVFAYLNDASQKLLHPGDDGCSEMARMPEAVEYWPFY